MAILSNIAAYQPFLLDVVPGAEMTADGERAVESDWTQHLELDAAKQLVCDTMGPHRRLKVLVLYGSLRER
jgi:hypothetical protein